MRSRKSVAKRNDFESVLLHWIIKFNIREERLVELLSVAEKIWPAQLEAKISESRARVFFLTLDSKRERRNLRLIISRKFWLCVLHRRSANLDGENSSSGKMWCEV